MVINVTKVKTNDIDDIFSYRDENNDEKIIRFPTKENWTEAEVDNYLNFNF